jgi:hypothetical protein
LAANCQRCGTAKASVAIITDGGTPKQREFLLCRSCAEKPAKKPAKAGSAPAASSPPPSRIEDPATASAESRKALVAAYPVESTSEVAALLTPPAAPAISAVAVRLGPLSRALAVREPGRPVLVGTAEG